MRYKGKQKNQFFKIVHRIKRELIACIDLIILAKIFHLNIVELKFLGRCYSCVKLFYLFIYQ